MACGRCAQACGAGCGCDCHLFTSPERAGDAGRRLSRLWDRARDLKARAGLRPYSVTIVRAQSAGMRARGSGPTEIVGEWCILPVPRVSDLTALTEVLAPDQLREAGTVVLSEISLAYSEQVLLGRGEGGEPIPRGETVYYEIALLDGAGRVTLRRRFLAASAPYAKAETAEWVINLVRAPWDRDADGTPR
jgi:hypothetical protein